MEVRYKGLLIVQHDYLFKSCLYSCNLWNSPVLASVIYYGVSKLDRKNKGTPTFHLIFFIRTQLPLVSSRSSAITASGRHVIRGKVSVAGF